jgi:cytoskeleton protein RodZ
MSPTIGEQLRAAREDRKLSLEDAFKATRIRIPYLQALENNDLDSLPSKVHARGFLRSYTSYLEFNPEIGENSIEVEKDLPPEVQEPAAVKKEKAKKQPEPELMDEEPVIVTQEPIKENIPPVQQAEVITEPTYFAIYREIGEKLRKQREKISLSLDDISLHTRLKLEYLGLIEEGRMDELPSPVQSRGMISNYSEFLNLDTETLLSRFADALQLKRLEKLPLSSPDDEEKKKDGRNRSWETSLEAVSKVIPVQTIKRLMTPDLLIGGGLIILLLVLVVWGAVQVFNPGVQGAAPTAPSISEVLLQTGTPIPDLAVTPEAGTSGETSENLVMPTGAAPSAEVTLNVNTGSQPIQVYVIANQRTLLRVIVDGSEKINERVLPGNAYQFSGYGRIELVTGNGAAIKVIYNQTDLGILGDTGEVVDLVFTKDEMGTATPSQKPTATRTLVPTLTLKPSPTPTVTLYVP